MSGLLAFVVAVIAVPDRPDPTPKQAQAPPLRDQLVGEWVLAKYRRRQRNAPQRPDHGIHPRRLGTHLQP